MPAIFRWPYWSVYAEPKAPTDNLAPPWSPGATTCARDERGPMHPMRVASRKSAANRTRKPDFPFRQRFKSCKSFIFLPRPLGDDLRLWNYLVMLSETF